MMYEKVLNADLWVSISAPRNCPLGSTKQWCAFWSGAVISVKHISWRKKNKASYVIHIYFYSSFQ